MAFAYRQKSYGGAISRSDEQDTTDADCVGESDKHNPCPVNAIGVDLGTCSMRVAYWENNDVKMIRSDRGNVSIPCCVAFTATGVLVGEEAADQANENIQDTIQAPQRLVGNRFENPWIQWYMKNWPGKVVVGEDQKPLIRLQNELVRPETILAHLLAHAKTMAERSMCVPVNEVTITVPSCFGAQQKAALAEACRGAGLDVVDFIRSPTSAALAYYRANPSNENRDVLVCDMGGSYLNFVLMRIHGDSYYLERAVGTDFIDLDSSMVRFCMADLKDRCGKCIAGNKLAQSRVRSACEVAKKHLSTNRQANISIDKLLGSFDYTITISRGQFEDMCDRDVESMLDPIDYCLEDCGLSRFDVDVVLVGGCARIPRIRRAMIEFFHGQMPKEVIHPENAAALGAAVAAAVFSEQRRSRLPYGLPRIRVDQAEFGGGASNGRSTNNLVPALDFVATAAAASASLSSFKEVGRSSSRASGGRSVRGVTAPHSVRSASSWCPGGVDHKHPAGFVPLRPEDDEPAWHEDEPAPRNFEKPKLLPLQDNTSESTADKDEAACPSTGASAIMSSDCLPQATSPVSSERAQGSSSHRSVGDVLADDFLDDVAVAVSEISLVPRVSSRLPWAAQDTLAPCSARNYSNSLFGAGEKVPHLRNALQKVSECRDKVSGSGGSTLSSPSTATTVASSSSWDLPVEDTVSITRPLKSSLAATSPSRPRAE